MPTHADSLAHSYYPCELRLSSSNTGPVCTYCKQAEAHAIEMGRGAAERAMLEVALAAAHARAERAGAAAEAAQATSEGVHAAVTRATALLREAAEREEQLDAQLAAARQARDAVLMAAVSAAGPVEVPPATRDGTAARGEGAPGSAAPSAAGAATEHGAASRSSPSRSPARSRSPPRSPPARPAAELGSPQSAAAQISSPDWLRDAALDVRPLASNPAYMHTHAHAPCSRCAHAMRGHALTLHEPGGP